MSSTGAPSRSKRAECWAARDRFFACLDAHGLWVVGLRPETHDAVLAVDPLLAPRVQDAAVTGKITPKAPNGDSLVQCLDLHKAFCTSCLPSWVDHFCKIRVKDLQTSALASHESLRETSRVTNQDSFWENARKKPQ